MPPPAADGSQDPDFAAETKRRDRELKTANLYGTRKGSLDTLLDMLGLDADSFTEARLPRSQSVGRFPARR
jgi:hypothetical protein